MLRSRTLAISTILLTSGSAVAQVSATFEFITDPLTKHLAFSANDLSPDGRWVVGSLDTDGDQFGDLGYRWDRVNNQFTYIENFGGAFVEAAVAVSDDGAVVLGNLPGETEVLESTAAIWTDADGWTDLGYLPNAGTCPSRSNGYEISGDGSIVVGLSWEGCSGRGFRWTQAGGMEALQVLGSGGNRASVMSSDGSVIAGFAAGMAGRTPGVWNGNTLTGSMLDVNGETQGEYQGINDDGSILLGSWWLGDADGGFDATMVVDGVVSRIAAGSLLPGWAGTPMDISDNGTIVGFDRLSGNRRAWILPKGEGELQELVAWLNGLGANVPSGTPLRVIQAISDDGTTIVGHSGAGTPAWVVTIDWGDDCIADLNGDGELDFLDISAFLAAYNAGQPLADLNDDGQYDFLDISAFLASYSAGCP